MLRTPKFAFFIDSHCDLEGCAASTRTTYHRLSRTFGRWLGRPPTIHDLDDDTVNRFVAWMAANRSRAYARGARNFLQTMRRARGIDGQIAKVRVDWPNTKTWSPGDIRRLLASCGCLDDMKRTAGSPVGLARGEYLAAWIRLSFDSCQRPADIHRFRKCQVTPGTPFPWIQHKTGRPVLVRITNATDEIVRRLEFDGDTYFPRVVSDESIRLWLRKVCCAAGLPYYGRKGMRRAAGTAAEIANPGMGHRALGNSRATFERHYWDRSQSPGEYYGPGEL